MACQKQILDFIGYSNYEAHSTGKIYNIKLQRYMSTYTNNAGYTCVSITNDQGKKCNELVHVLVAKAFLKNPKGLSDVGHCDANKSNNASSNLEWTTHSENIKKMYQDKATVTVSTEGFLEATQNKIKISFEVFDTDSSLFKIHKNELIELGKQLNVQERYSAPLVQSESTNAFDSEVFIKRLSKGIIVASILNSKVIGYAGVVPSCYIDTAIITSLIVDNAHRNAGIGTQLLEKVNAYVKDVMKFKYISVNFLIKNPASRLYQRFGFEPLTYYAYKKV